MPMQTMNHEECNRGYLDITLVATSTGHVIERQLTLKGLKDRAFSKAAVAAPIVCATGPSTHVMELSDGTHVEDARLTDAEKKGLYQVKKDARRSSSWLRGFLARYLVWALWICIASQMLRRKGRVSAIYCAINIAFRHPLCNISFHIRVPAVHNL